VKLEHFDLIDNEPIYIDDIGTLSPPTLRKIKKLTFNVYQLYLFYATIKLNNYLEKTGLKDEYEKLDDLQKKDYSLYKLIIFDERVLHIFEELFNFFMIENVDFNKQTNTFVVWNYYYNDKTDENVKCVVGEINNDNFDDVRTYIAELNHLIDTDVKPEKYKNDRARKIMEKINKGKAELNKKSKYTLDLSHEISKFCADNKNGINILNVWDMTIYQFYDQFGEHSYLKQCDLQDKIYANTVSFSETSDYDPQMWTKTIN
jgi:hypothetical protein